MIDARKSGYNKYTRTKSSYLNLKEITLKNMFGGTPTGNEMVDTHLKLIEKMDFEGFNKQRWDIVDEVLDENVVTTFSNGMVLNGRKPSVNMLMKQAITWAPDIQVKHRFNFGSGNFTCTNLLISGTFTQTMKAMQKGMEDIEATGKPFTMNNCSIAYWKDNKIKELYVFGDSYDFMKQLGIAEQKMNMELPPELTSTKFDDIGFDDVDTLHDCGNGDEQVKKNLSSLQQIDFAGFNKRDWNIVEKLLDKNITSIFSNGEKVAGRDKNIELMKQSLDFAPDTHVKHQIQFGSGDMTCVYILVSGTFKNPLKAKDGTLIEPTDKKYVMRHCAVEQWNNGILMESYIFTDTLDAMRQFKTNKLF